MRQIKCTGDGPSQSIIVPNSGHESWWLLVVEGVNGATCRLESSIDNDNWFNATENALPVDVTFDMSLRVSGGLYYRLNISNYVSEVKVTVKPT